MNTMTIRKAIAGWLKDADAIPGAALVRELATEHDQLLVAVEDLLDLMKLSWEEMEQVKAARALVAKAKGQP